MRRHRKKPRILVPQVPEPAEPTDETTDEEHDNPPVRRKRNHVPRGDDDDDDLPAPALDEEDARIEALIAANKWAFCCATCACSAERRQRAKHLKYVVSGDGRLPHRPCCHGVLDQSPPPEWASSYETAEAHASAALEAMLLGEDDSKPAATYEPVESSLAHKQYLSAKRQESLYVNLRETEDPQARLYSNTDYQDVSRAFAKRVGTPDQGAVVLDLFSGMGTTVVALKRLSIALRKIISCEQDKVASHVYQENHHCPEKSTTEDNVEWCHYPWFENIAGTEENYHAFMDKHAPIDIVVAGPPCQDFTGINASRRGLDGSKGAYMMETARLIRRIQSDRRQGDRPLYYLLENVVLRNDKDLPLAEGDKELIQQAIGCSWDAVELDAACVSPCTRLRSFITNIPLRSWSERQAVDLLCNPTSVLQDGFRLAGNLDVYEPNMLAKVPTFMASKARLNDDRMRVYREGKPYVSRIINRSERLLLMGFPPDYLDCLDRLYEALLHNGHAMVGSKHWTETLEPRYHTFQGAFHGKSNPYEFVDVPAPANSGVPRCVEMQLLPFLAGPSDFLNAEDYGKRLLGNAISVPVLEYCLSELNQVFGTRRYPGYDYKYAWQKQPTFPPASTTEEACEK